MDEPPIILEIPADGGEPAARPMTAEEIATAEAAQAEHEQRRLAAEQAQAERLAIVKARAAEDPAYAALVELLLGAQAP